MKFQDLLNKYKIVRAWGLKNELKLSAGKLTDPSEVMELVDTAVKYIIDNTAPYEYKAISTINTRASLGFSYIFVNSLISYAIPEAVIESVLPQVIRLLFAEMTYDYYLMNETEEEEKKEEKRKRVNGCVELIARYAKKYPIDMAYGLTWFVEIVDDTVDYMKRRIERFKDQPWMIMFD